MVEYNSCGQMEQTSDRVDIPQDIVGEYPQSNHCQCSTMITNFNKLGRRTGIYNSDTTTAGTHQSSLWLHNEFFWYQLTQVTYEVAGSWYSWTTRYLAGLQYMSPQRTWALLHPQLSFYMLVKSRAQLNCTFTSSVFGKLLAPDKSRPARHWYHRDA